jgi:hypothetical protein
MKEDVMRHIKECTTCRENKDEHTHPTLLPEPNRSTRKTRTEPEPEKNRIKKPVTKNT